MNQIDLFRLNCFFNDSEANDLKTILKSLICEYIYENKNQFILLSEVIGNLTGTIKLNVDIDLVNSIVSDANDFEVNSLENDNLIKLTSAKFAKIDTNIKDHSIEKYIKEYVAKVGLDPEVSLKITEILQIALYENINSFSTSDLKSILPIDAKQRFSQSEIDVFNAFLDFEDSNKDTALYNVFLKAVEFSIITSGRGISKLNKDLLKGKTYILDTNIIFRLLGIGGAERQETLIGLIKSCNHQGITFAYTLNTFLELKAKLAQIINALKLAESKGQIKIMADILESKPMYFNNDFITHYSTLRKKNIVSNPSNYEIKLYQDFKRLANELNFLEADVQKSIPESEVLKLAADLIKRRKLVNEHYKYSRTAAKVDAFNVLYVRSKRGFNNYNYTDIKSFYLTTDRSLNKILSSDLSKNIPETILPSQLYLLHNPYSDTTDDIDYKLFVLFLKRRTTEFKYRGVDVLNYIGQIRQHSHDENIAKEILEVYADRRFDHSKDLALRDTNTFIPFQEFKDQYLDTLSKNYKEGFDQYSNMKKNSFDKIPSYISKSQNLTKLADVSIYLSLVFLTLIFKDYFKDFWTLIALIAVLELIKFVITKAFPILKPIWRMILLGYLRSSPYYKLTNDQEFLDQAISIIEEKKFNPW